MKKTLIALSVLVAAGSVNAATVYDNDGLKVGLYGDIAVHYQQDRGADKDMYLNLDDADYGFTVESAVNEDMSVFGKIEMDGEDSSKGNVQSTPQIDEAFVGFKASGVEVTAGSNLNIVDDIGISNDNEWGLDTAEDVIGLAADAEQVINVKYNSDMFYAAFSSTSASDGDDTTDGDLSQIAVAFGINFDGGNVVATYADEDTTATTDANVLALEAHYDVTDDVALAAIYAAGEDTAKNDVSSYAFNVEYSMDKTSFNLGLSDVDSDDNSDDVQMWYANVNYKVAKNTKVFLELSDTDVDNVDMGYAAGMAISF